jgi:transposase
LAAAEGLEATDAAALRRMDRKRKKKTSNEDWESPSDGEAEITKLKDGRTALAYKAENAVDMETGAIVAELLTAAPPAGKYAVHPGEVEEVVADKGYHSNQAVVSLGELVARTYIAEPDRGTRDWDGKQAEKEAVYGNRRCVRGERGKRMQRRRGEKIERNFAHQFDTGGLDRLYVRGIGNSRHSTSCAKIGAFRHGLLANSSMARSRCIVARRVSHRKLRRSGGRQNLHS